MSAAVWASVNELVERKTILYRKEQATLSLYEAMSELAERRQRAFRYLYKTALAIFSLALAIPIYAV